jgi:N-acetylmuramoyl-L-alanine amidase
VLALALLALSACAPLSVYTNLPVEVRPSPNFGERRPNYVILHHTSNSDAGRAVATLTSPIAQVSAHYLVVRDGRIVYLVDERLRAWHAGESFWGGNRDLNSSSIGIELDNDGDEPYAEPQIDALLALLADLKSRWTIPAANFLGHGDVAPGRKADPGANFPWKRLAARGFGLWCDPPYDSVPAGTDDALLLAALGYDVSNLPAAVDAFRRHYGADESTAVLSEGERGMAQCMLKRRERGE